MTDYNVLSDRELDKLVAERLLNVKVYVNDNNQLFYPDVGWIDETGYVHPVLRYSTDMNAALALIKSTFRLETGRAAHDRVMWRANVTLSEAFWVTANTPARAIVLAWLAWQDAQGE